MLLQIVNGFIESRAKAAEGDVLKGRFEELRRFFKFTDLEMDAIKYAFVRSSTAFESDPYRGRRSNNDLKNERLNFFAMCIDHSVAEVRELRNNESRLRKYDFLDDDLSLDNDRGY